MYYVPNYEALKKEFLDNEMKKKDMTMSKAIENWCEHAEAHAIVSSSSNIKSPLTFIYDPKLSKPSMNLRSSLNWPRSEPIAGRSIYTKGLLAFYTYYACGRSVRRRSETKSLESPLFHYVCSCRT